MNLKDAITIMNLVCLVANLIVGIIGAVVVFQARKLNKEFKLYLDSRK